MLSTAAAAGRRIEIRVRDDTDIDVAFHVPEKRGSPFEQVITGPSEDAAAVQASVVEFVSDLVAERTVLAMDRRFFKGGRRFIQLSGLRPAGLKYVSWVVSWQGTHDRDPDASAA